MKQMSKEKKAVQKDRISTILLCGLVALSVVLSAQLWFQRKLWSEDYNFFSDFMNQQWVQQIFGWFGGEETLPEAGNQEAFMPRRYAVNYSTLRASYPAGSEAYNALNAEVKILLKTLFETENDKIQNIDNGEEVWQQALKGRSIYLNFESAYPVTLLSSFFGVAQSPAASWLQEVREVVIVLSDSITTDTAVYLKDAGSGQVVKIGVRYDRNQFYRVLEPYYTEEDTAYKFSYELNFHQRQMNAAVVRADVLFPITALNADILAVEDMGVVMTAFEERILRGFGHNPRNNRRYPETDTCTVFVENQSTLKLDRLGYIGYEAASGREGLPLSSYLGSPGGTASVKALYDAVMSFLAEFTDMTDALYLSHTETDGNKVTFRFNYLHDGHPIVLEDAEGKAVDALVIEVENSAISKLDWWLKKYRTEGELTILPPIPGILDEVIERSGLEPGAEVSIRALSLRYQEKTDSEEVLMPKWYVALDDRSFLLETAHVEE